MRYSVLITFLLIGLSRADSRAQGTSKWENIQPLTVGDTCPDFKLSNVINYPKRSVSLSDYKDKWLILDFWATWCAPCIAMLPKTAQIEKDFNGKIHFMPLTMDKEEKVRKLFSNMNEGSGVNYQCVVASEQGTVDTLVYSLFRRKTIPHYVWINPEGIIRAITGSEDVTAANISAMLSDSNFKLPIKNDDDGISTDLSPFTIPDLRATKAISYSTLTGYMNDGSPSSYNIVRPDSLAFTNLSVVMLYRFAYGYLAGMPYYPKGMTAIETGNNKIYNNEFIDGAIENQKWKRDFTYCYRLRLPSEKYGVTLSNGESLREHVNTDDYKRKKVLVSQFMIEDLNRAFNLHPVIQKREVDCYVLICTDSLKLSKQSHSYAIDRDKLYHLKINSSSTADLIKELRPLFSNKEIIDETRLIQKFDIEINTKLNDLEKLNKILNNYGLNLKEATRTLNVLVIKE